MVASKKTEGSGLICCAKLHNRHKGAFYVRPSVISLGESAHRNKIMEKNDKDKTKNERKEKPSTIHDV